MVAPRNKTSKARVLKLKRQAQALELRRGGLSYSAIAQKIGISKSRAQALVELGLADAKAQITASADDLKAIELSRLDGMLARLWPMVEKGDLQAMDRAIKIGERRAKLQGLDAPTRTALEGGGEGAPPIATEATVTFYMPDNGRG